MVPVAYFLNSLIFMQNSALNDQKHGLAFLRLVIHT